jgi:hypothetical protein
MHLASDAEQEQRCDGNRRTDERTATHLGSAKSLRLLLSTSVRLPAVRLAKPLSDPERQYQKAVARWQNGHGNSGHDGWHIWLLQGLHTSVRSQARSQGCILAVCSTSSATCTDRFTPWPCCCAHTPSRSCSVSRWRFLTQLPTPARTDWSMITLLIADLFLPSACANPITQ